jgi:hypothetical protein
MPEKIRKLIGKYLTAASIGGVLVCLTLWLNDFSSLTEKLDRYRVLTDAFSIPGVILIMVGCLVFISTDGFFDMISYALSKLGRSLVPFSKKTDESYYDYKTRKSGQRFTGYSFLFFTGLAFLAVALVFLALFFANYQK